MAVAPAPRVAPDASVAENVVAPEPTERVEPAPSWIEPEPVFLACREKVAEAPGETAPGESEPAT